MSDGFARRGAAYVNELNRSMGALLGIATGVLADKHLNDNEIAFLERWLESNSTLATVWPGDVIHARVKAALADGVVTEEERQHLVLTLQQLIGGTLDQLAAATHSTQMLEYETVPIEYDGSTFCLTGEFACAPRGKCEGEITALGGIVKSSVSKKLRYLLVGGLGSTEWKHGSFGTKIERAMELKREGVPIVFIHEEHWVGTRRA